MNILFIGDVTGKAGISFVAEVLPQLQRDEKLDLIVANGENAAWNGRGLTVKALEELFDAGVEMVTLGNHTWDQKEIYDRLDRDDRLCRPANFQRNIPGRGHILCDVGGKKVAIINLIGRTFMGLYECPFQTAENLITELEEITSHIIVDFHAEVTSEKLALAWHVAGKVSAIVGTHTHVQTADERILPGGTAYITDVGMTGPRNGVIGLKRELMIRKFINQMPVKHELEDGARQFSAVMITLGESGKATGIKRLFLTEN